MIRCIVIDDEQHALDLLSGYIKKIPLLDLQLVTTSPLEAFQYLQQKKTDLIFLDIQMPEFNGMRFLELVKGKSKVILTTAYAEYALEGYEHEVTDYLLKPITFERFLKAAQKAINHLTTVATGSPLNEAADTSDFIFIKAGGRKRIVRVLLQEIQYIEGLGNYLSIYMPSRRIVTLLTIKEIHEKLPAGRFIRIHNSYVVPINKIDRVEGNEIYINQHKLPIGDVYKKAFLNAIEKHIIRGKDHDHL